MYDKLPEEKKQEKLALRPKLTPFENEVYSCFKILNNSRSLGMNGFDVLNFRDIIEAIKFKNIYEKDWALILIQMLDKQYLEHCAKRQKDGRR